MTSRGVVGREASATGSPCVWEPKRSHEETRASGVRLEQSGVTEALAHIRRRRPNRVVTHNSEHPKKCADALDAVFP